MRHFAISALTAAASLAVVLVPNVGIAAPGRVATEPGLAQGDSRWAFEETFDGTPDSPQVFASQRFQVIASSDNLDGIIDGQTVDGSRKGLIEAGHGPDCGAPIGTAHNNHVLAVDFDLLGFQTNTRPQLTYLCNGHMMTTVKAGYGVVSFMPRQAFDWANRTGVIEFDTNVYSYGREWWDVYIVPEDQMPLEILQRGDGGGGEQLPKQGVRFSFGSEKPSVQAFDDYKVNDEWVNWQRFVEAFPSDPALTDPKTRRTFRLELSQNGWGFNIQKQDGSFWSFNGGFKKPLGFTRGLVRIEHHSYNPTKDGLTGDPWSQYTFHWDNLHFDGPVLPLRPAYGPGPHLVDLMHEPNPNNVLGVSIDLPAGVQNPVLVGHVDSMLQNDDVDPHNLEHWRQYRINAGDWQDLPLLKDVATGGDRGWSTFRVAGGNLVAGANRIEFRYPTRPAQATWQWNGFRVKDVEIQVEPAVAAPTE